MLAYISNESCDVGESTSYPLKILFLFLNKKNVTKWTTIYKLGLIVFIPEYRLLIKYHVNGILWYWSTDYVSFNTEVIPYITYIYWFTWLRFFPMFVRYTGSNTALLLSDFKYMRQPYQSFLVFQYILWFSSKFRYYSFFRFISITVFHFILVPILISQYRYLASTLQHTQLNRYYNFKKRFIV